jgi:N,N'-diacetyl-8-epilegionaminate cytidylyltransferase
MKAYGFIFARGGSKGVPGKNIKPLCGKPLIAHAIETGLHTGLLEKIVVSTDSEEIAAVARQYGAEVPFLRPAELASDTAPEILAWKHAVRFLQDRGETFDVFVSLPATVPLRTPEDVRRCLERYQEGDCDIVITCMESPHNPYFNMVRLDADHNAGLAFEAEGKPARRQDAPVVYAMTAVAYVTSPQYILHTSRIWDGRVKAVVVDRINGTDIDSQVDFALAEFFMSRRAAGPGFLSIQSGSQR